MSPLAGDRERGGDVLVAPATPPGVSALAVVRLTGPAGAARAVARRLAPDFPAEPVPRQALLLRLVDAEGRALDRAVVLFWAAPHSPTGEEVVEFVCHGSSGVVLGLVDAARRAGARPAERGEFTRRALAHGKLDLAEAEGLAVLARAESRGAARRALGLVEGALSKRVHAARERALDALAALEAALDFAEDVPAGEATRAGAEFAAIAAELDALARSARGAGERKPVVAILGRPNAGKSTLFNALVGSDRAIVTATPGTTRDAITETVEIAGESVTLVDTAGLRDATEEVERIGVDVATRAGENADLVLYVVDALAGRNEEDEDFLRGGRGEKTLVVMTKADLVPLSSSSDLSVSALTGAGLDALRAAAAARLGLVEAEGELLVLARHKEALESAARLLAEAGALAAGGSDAELVAARAREGLVALGAITGETATEDLLDRIFSTFCVGK
ncbi:MAG: tRNA uridine-5-carboxymethylaminomethyl(34) synthesis GTPase MnmE [Acidobacteria bacterium]|nr:tRNA uridine-5-carboxymethylaminomethyl(34) synthesis GTPase MnmE [Acidobacteriota bacterium]